MTDEKKAIATGVTVLSLLLLVIILFSSFKSVDGGDKAVVTGKFGKDIKSVEGPGLKIAPFSSFTSYKCGLAQTVMSKSAGEGDKPFDDSVSGASKEGARISFDITVNYHIDCSDQSVKFLFTERIRSEQDIRDRVVRPAVRSAVRDAAAKYNALEVTTSARTAVQAAVTKSLDTKFAARPSNGSVILDSVEIREIYLPENIQVQVNRSIETQAAATRIELERQAKTAQAETDRQVAEQQAKVAVITANAAAEKARIEAESAAKVRNIAAKASSDAAKLEGEGKAAAIKAVAEAITPSYSELETARLKAEALAKVGSLTVVDGGQGSGNGTFIFDGRK